MIRLGTVYHAPELYGHHLLTELAQTGRPVRSVGGGQDSGHLHQVFGEPVPTFWHQNLWLEPYEISFDSISDAAAKLRSLGALWAPVPTNHFRKSELIQQKLPRLPQRLKPFPFALPAGRMGAWALVDESTLWASPTTSSPFAGGVIPLQENKTDPPSSAYLKLQEALTLLGHCPSPTDICLDAGSSPGGWSWVLAGTGARVFSVDKAPLDPKMSGFSNLTFQTGNAFALKPDDFPGLTWLLCDVICYPDKLWAWLQPWLKMPSIRHFVITVKMQGEDCDWGTLAEFASVPGSRLTHLFHNKHELTWLLSRP